MSMPPNSPYSPQAPDMSYLTPPASSGLAIASMVLGIIGVVTSCLGIGVLLGLIGLIVGIVALVKINRDPRRHGGIAFAIIGIVTGGVTLLMVPLLLAILLPSLGKARELSNRTACASNLRGITQGLIVYASDNSDAYPVVPYAPYGAANAGPSSDTGGATQADAMKWLYLPPSTQNGSPLASLFLLNLKSYTAPSQYLCKSDPFAMAPAHAQNAAGDFFVNFQDKTQISYSIAYPYTPDGKVGDWWKNATDSSLPLVADMAPLNGTGSPARNVAPGAMPSTARSWNSGNHQGDGQNVGYGDGHVEFTRRPDVGQDNDNIYTVSGTKGVSQFGGSQPGPSPIMIDQDKAPYDIVLVPARDLNTGALH